MGGLMSWVGFSELQQALIIVYLVALGQLFAIMATSGAGIWIGYLFVTWFNVFRTVKTAALNWKPEVGEPILLGGGIVTVLEVLDFDRVDEAGEREYVVVYRKKNR